MELLSRITHFQSLVIGLFDGLPAGTSPCAVENTGSGTGSEGSVTRLNGLVRLPTGGLDSSSPRQAQACHRARRRQGRPGNVVVCGTVRATADLDGVCARRRSGRQVGAKERLLDRTKEQTGSNPYANFLSSRYARAPLAYRAQ